MRSDRKKIELSCLGANLKDHRRHERISPKLRCWCEGDNVTIYARVSNLSEGGLFLRTPTTFNVQPHLRIRVPLTSELEMVALARVIWQKPKTGLDGSGIGLEFQTLNATQRQSLRRFIQTQSRLAETGRTLF